MSEMIERCSRALQQAITDACARGGGSCNGTPEGLLSVNANFQPQEVVRAIIAAMREPTQAMLDATIPRYQEHNRGDDPYASEMADYWTTMIDAALGDQS